MKQKEVHILVLMAMIVMNPKRKIDHKICDWVIENFIDFVLSYDSNFNSRKAALFWIKINWKWDFKYVNIIIRKVNKT